MKRILLFLFLLISLSVNTQDELLPADKAFSFKAKIVDDKILLNWNIAKGYYLYKKKIKIISDYFQGLGEAQFPVAKIKNDDFFGKVNVYRDNVLVTVPVLKGESKLIVVNVEFQGCADLGVCYPPMRKSATLKIGNNNKSLINNAFNTLSKAKPTMQSIVNKVREISDKPLSIDKALSYSVTAIDANTLRASWKIHPEYYLYYDKFFIGIKGAKFGDINFPKWEEKEDPFYGKVQIYKGEFSIDIPLTNIQSSKISFTAKFQGCWLGGICFPPVEKSTEITLPKIDNSVALEFIKAPTELTGGATKAGSLNETDKITALLQQDDVLITLWWFFVFGLLLSLTPCVFPMIPILSGIIVGQKDEVTTRKALIISIVFVLAMSVTYSMAGVLAGYFGENLQALFQTPWILILFSLIFVALAFSMFGYYEIQLPPGLQSKITNISNKQESGKLIGVAIMGFLSALIVGPCVVPPLAGALIYIGQTGDAALGGLSLFILSLGMGVPLLLVGAGVSKLPKTGDWMNNVKYVFGIFMLAVAIWLLDRIISPYMSLILWALLFTLSPIAIGVLNSLTKTVTAWQRIFKGIGLLILIYGVLLWGLVARGGGDMLAPLSNYRTSVQAEKVHVIFKKIKSSDDLNHVLTKAQSNNQIVMLDFYANWCISCKKLERLVFSNAKVVSDMKNVIALQADITANDATDKALIARFNIIGPPGILFFKDGVENRSQRIVGEVNVQDFLKHLNNSM